MRKILIFGNAGSGKSTLARRILARESIPHLDLDELAWLPGLPPERRPLAEAGEAIDRFVEANSAWVIEGCYGDLIERVLDRASEIIFLNLPVELCIENARNRPWEPHKYASREEQDANLETLIHWISDYPQRTDTLSLQAHRSLYERFAGKKTRYTASPLSPPFSRIGVRCRGRSSNPG